MRPHPIPPEEDESFRELVREELGAMLPFSAQVRNALASLGGLVVLTGRALAGLPRLQFAKLAYQVESLGSRSLGIAVLTAIFAGLVISLQFAFFLARFGVAHTVGKVVVLTLFRELVPVLIALTVGARIGSGIAAELGSMTVTEQVDAIRALGADPIRELVVPRMSACLLVLPALTVLADVCGLIAGAVVVKLQYGLPIAEFMASAMDTARMQDFTSGVLKSCVFGLIIAVVGCFEGLSVEGGTEGVGRGTTRTVAVASVAVCLADFLITKLSLSL